MGQDGARFQNNQIGLIDNETGLVDLELEELIRVAATGDSESIQWKTAGSDKGTTFVEVYIGGRWSTDVLRFEGSQLNDVLAALSDIPAIAEDLPTLLDLKNKASQIAIFDFDAKKNHFHGSTADVDSAGAKAVLSGSSINAEEAADLVAYALSEDGQTDENISVGFNGEGVIVSVDASRDTTDTFVFTGDAFFDALSTSTLSSGKSLVDLKNNNSQIGVFDFDEEKTFFHGSDADVDSAAAKEILGGSSLDAGEAEALVALALTGEDANVTYLGGDANSAIVAVDASRDTTDTLFISGSEFDFV